MKKRLGILLTLSLLIIACSSVDTGVVQATEPIQDEEPTAESTAAPTLSPAPTSTPIPPTATRLPPVALTSVEDLVGEWQRGERGQKFMEDGFFLSNESGNWTCRGQFWFEGNQLHIRDLTPFCSVDEVGIYEVQGVPQDYLIIKPVSDYSSSRSAHFRGMWQWLASQ
jgi:hypothetical protein